MVAKPIVYFLNSENFPACAMTEDGARELERNGYRRCSYKEWQKVIKSAAVPEHLSFLDLAKALTQKGNNGG